MPKQLVVVSDAACPDVEPGMIGVSPLPEQALIRMSEMSIRAANIIFRMIFLAKFYPI